jgi:Fe2+ transport system protein FeoA
VLEYLERAGVVPGSAGTLTALSPDGTATVDVAGASVALGAAQAARILVVRN